MAAITWDQVTAFASALSTFDSDAQTQLLAYVNGALNVNVFPDGESDDALTMARIYLAAHMATAITAASGGASGPVTSESELGVSRSYAWSSADIGGDSYYSITAYGKSYLAIIRRTIARVPLVL